MIVETGLYYLYRHIRLDTNQVFYIGIGKKDKWDIKNNSYTRANLKARRNIFWYRITSKTDYKVEIILESNDRVFIQEKEIEFIKLYGRRDQDKGYLTNLTDGGEVGLNCSKESKLKGIETRKKTGSYDKMIERLKKYAEGNALRRSPCLKKTYLYSIDGSFLKEFESRKLCAEYIGIGGANLSALIRNRESYNGWYFTYFYEEQLNSSLFRIVTYKREVVCICPITYKILSYHKSLQEAGESVKSGKSNIWHSITKLKKCKGFYWSHKENYEGYIEALQKKKSAPYPPELRKKAQATFAKYLADNPSSNSHEKAIINIETGEKLSGVSKILHEVGLTRKLMVRRLSGEIVNNTPYRYLDNKYSKKKVI